MLENLLGQILVAVLIPVAAIVGTLVGRYIVNLIGKIKNEQLQQLAYRAVLWAEQTLEGVPGNEKFAAVYDYIASKFPGVDDGDIEKAIEAAVKSMNMQIKKIKKK